MSFGESLLFYLAIGAAVAVGQQRFDPAAKKNAPWLGPAACCLFWPLFLPLALSAASAEAKTPHLPPPDELAASIEQVETELDAALASLEGWAGDVVSRRAEQVQELRGALVHQAERIREMETLLAR